MGEAADMMLEGLCCAGCGEFIDGEELGYLRYCASCSPDYEDEQNTGRPYGMSLNNFGLSKKLLRRLKIVSIKGTDTRIHPPYCGDPWKYAPEQYEKLKSRGLVTRMSPHNLVHEDRAIITAAGLALLEQVKP